MNDSSIVSASIARIPAHGTTVLTPGLKGLLFHPASIRNLYVPTLIHPDFDGRDKDGNPCHYERWGQRIVLEDKDAPQGEHPLVNRAVRNARIGSTWRYDPNFTRELPPLPAVSTFHRTKLAHPMGTNGWLLDHETSLHAWWQRAPRFGFPCRRCLALGASVSRAGPQSHEFVISSIDKRDATWFAEGAELMARFYHLHPESAAPGDDGARYVFPIDNGPPGFLRGEYRHDSQDETNEGDFVPYWRRVAQMIMAVRTFRQREPDARLDFLALFCHGWNDGCQLGLVARGAQGEHVDARDLTESFLREVADIANEELSVVLYACRTATADGTFGIYSYRHLTLSASIREALYEYGVRKVRVDGHVDSADGIRARRVRRFEGSNPRGEWVVAPPRAEELREEAEAAFVEDIDRMVRANEVERLLAAAQRMGVAAGPRSMRRLFTSARNRLRNGALARAEQEIAQCLGLFDFLVEASSLREQLWTSRNPPDLPDSPAERRRLCPRGETMWLGGRYEPAIDAFRACLVNRGLTPLPPTENAGSRAQVEAREATAEERAQLQENATPPMGYDPVRWEKWDRSLAMGYEYWPFRFPLMGRDEIHAWLDALPDRAPCLSDWRVTQAQANAARRGGSTPPPPVVDAHLWLWEGKKPVGCLGRTRRQPTPEGHFSSAYIAAVPTPSVRPPRRRRGQRPG